MPAAEITKRQPAMPAQALRRGLDEELWQKLDKKLAEREASAQRNRAGASTGILARIARGMGLKRD